MLDKDIILQDEKNRKRRDAMERSERGSKQRENGTLSHTPLLLIQKKNERSIRLCKYDALNGRYNNMRNGMQEPYIYRKIAMQETIHKFIRDN